MNERSPAATVFDRDFCPSPPKDMALIGSSAIVWLIYILLDSHHLRAVWNRPKKRQDAFKRGQDFEIHRFAGRAKPHNGAGRREDGGGGVLAAYLWQILVERIRESPVPDYLI